MAGKQASMQGNKPGRQAFWKDDASALVGEVEIKIPVKYVTTGRILHVLPTPKSQKRTCICQIKQVGGAAS